MHRNLWLVLLLCVLVVAACREGGDVEETPPPATAGATIQPEPETPPEDAPQPASEQEAEGRRAAKDRSQAEEQATATPAREPLPAPDPDLPEWTIMVYMAAGDGLDAAALRDLNGLEAAGESVRVNVLAQAQLSGETGGQGWRGARRYEMRFDEDPAQLNSLLQAELGQIEMGDPAALGGFVAWGLEHYPANHYALIVWDHGGAVTQATLAPGLQQGLAQSDRSRLDVVGFDAGRVSRLEVYDALQAHADFAVASSQPAREPGWHYESLLGDLFTEPLVAPGDLAQAMAQRYVDFRSGERGDAYVNMMAVDLARFGAVSGALEALAGVLQDELPVALSDVVAARQAAGVGGGATIDLHRFAAALSQHSAHRRVVEASGALLRALDDVVLLQARGVRLPEAGDIAFYFPQRGSPQGAGEFAEAGAAPAWAEFLVAYYEAAGEHGAPPLVSAALRDEGAASAQRPAYVDLEIGGWHMETVTAAVARREEEGRLRLLAHDALTPNPAGPGDESAPWYWPGGVSEEFYVWDTTAAYVSDGANGDFAPLWPVAAHGELLAVAGQYVAPGEDEGREASLVFEADTGQLHAVWGYDEGASPPRPIGPQMGAGFQVYNHYLGDERAISYEPGVTLVFTEGAAFTYDHYPLPGGDYVLQFAAESAGGRVAEAQAAVAVDNEALTPGLQAYLDPYYGFQFLYPLTWPAPAYESGQLAAVDAEGDRRFSVSLWPQTVDAAALKEAALETFGAVTVLYETQATAGGETALLTAYGYEAEGESRTGVLATFGHGGRDLGVVVDLDGPATGEAETMALMDAVLSGWQFRPVGLDAAPGGWTRREVGGLDMAVPSDYAYERLENGWERLSSGDVFLALRTEPASGMGRPAIVARWLEVAGNGVEGFEAGAPQRFALAGAGWSRADFSYESSGAIVRGLLMATIVDSREVVAWVEAPDAGFQQLESNVFLVMLADAVAAAMGGAGESGLLYEETFDEEGSWGAGGVEGAAAAVTGGAYNLSVSAEQGFFWATAGQSFADGVFEVDAVQTEGPLDNGYGLLLRASAEQEAFYALEISGDGFVWIGRCEDGCARRTTLVGEGWFYSGAVRQGLDARNRLRVEADGDTLRFFVNGAAVGQVQDADATPGDVGVFVETLGEGGVTVAFDNVRVVAP